MATEARGIAKNEKINIFANGEPAGNKYVVSGIFWNKNKEYLEEFSKILKKISEINDAKELEEQVFPIFQNFLRKVGFSFKEDAIYDIEKIRDIYVDNLWDILGDKDVGKFFRYASDKTFKLSNVNIVNEDNKVKQSSFFKTSGIRIRSLKPPMFALVKIRNVVMDREDGYIPSQRRWEYVKEVISEYRSKNLQVDYINKIDQIINFIENDNEEGWKIYGRLLYYLFPISFDKFLGHPFVRVRFFGRKKSLDKLINEIEQEPGKKGEMERLYYGIGKHILKLQENYTVDEKKALAKNWLMEVLSYTFNEENLKSLRKDWIKIIKNPPSNLSIVLLEKGGEEEIEFSYGEFTVPFSEIEVDLVYEKGYEEEYGLGSVANILSDKFLNEHTKEVRKKVGRFIPINEFIPFFDDLKELRREDLKNNTLEVADTEKLLFSLLVFTIKLSKLEQQIKEDKKARGIMFLLSADKKSGEGYFIWDLYRMIYSMFSLPVQTINKSVFEKLRSKEKGIQAVHKNLIISFLKDTKKLRFNYSGLKVPQKVKTIYVVVESPSSSFFFDRSSWDINGDERGYHYHLSVYRIDITQNNEKKEGFVDVKFERSFTLLYGRLDDDTKDFRDWIENTLSDDVMFCFLTRLNNSRLEVEINSSYFSNIIKNKSIQINYQTIPLNRFSENKERSDGIIIYSDKMEEIMERLGIDIPNDKTLIAVKINDPMSLIKFKIDLDGEEEYFYHSTLQVFMTDKLGINPDEQYEERKGLIILTIMSLLQYTSDSYNIPYSKLEVNKKKDTFYGSLKRGSSQHVGFQYIASINALLYEMYYIAKRLPLNNKTNNTKP